MPSIILGEEVVILIDNTVPSFSKHLFLDLHSKFPRYIGLIYFAHYIDEEMRLRHV